VLSDTVEGCRSRFVRLCRHIDSSSYRVVVDPRSRALIPLWQSVYDMQDGSVVCNTLEPQSQMFFTEA
jgi:hypothetical protein